MAKQINFKDIRKAATRLFKERFNFVLDMERPIDEQDLENWQVCIDDAMQCATEFGLAVVY